MKKIFSILFLFILMKPLQAQENKSPLWRPLVEGLQEAQYKTQDSKGSVITLRLYKVDLKKYKLKVVQASEYQSNTLSVKDFVSKSNGVIGVNGGFFDTEFKPLGVIIREGLVLNPPKPVSWWSVFSIDKNDQPEVKHVSDFQPSPSYEMAIEAGPRLVLDSNPVTSKPNISTKTFLGISSDDQVVLGVTEASVIDTNDLANILSKEVKLKQALNLDGGSSTQLYAKVASYEKDQPGFSPVANAVVVVPKR
ncbi:MAG: phosphodiester glycosidase family protein [Deltaproteobacteria bacterium]|nr:phosphodiester glycosidase family protein [Deltaproteobacteria bacterium]